LRIQAQATSNRARISNNESVAAGVQAELQALRLKVRELETENSRLKSKLYSKNSEMSSLQAELQEVKDRHKHLSFQADFLNKQKQQYQANALLGENYEHLKRELIAFSEALREKNQSWFVACR
jgi:predicted nuclease with TOPRIM domain